MVFGSSVVYNECTSPECSGVVVTDLSLFSLRVHDQCAVLASPLRLVFISPPRLSLAFSSTVINFGTSWEECRGFSEDGEGGVLAGGCVGGGLVRRDRVCWICYWPGFLSGTLFSPRVLLQGLCPTLELKKKGGWGGRVLSLFAFSHLAVFKITVLLF